MEKKSVGRPSLFKQIPLSKFKELYEKGLTEKEIAKSLGVSEATIYNWKNKNVEFLESLKDWKSKADAEVEQALYKSACGFVVKNKKAIVVSDGKDVGSHIEYVDEYIQYPPNATSMIFWLKNRQPDKWRDVKESKVSGELDVTVISEEIEEARRRARLDLRGSLN